MANTAQRRSRRALIAAQRAVMRFSKLGTHGLADRDARYVLMGNSIAMLSMSAFLFFAVFYWAYLPQTNIPVALTLLGASALFGVSIWLNHLGFHVAATLFKAVVLTLTLIQNEWYLGRSLGASQFFFAAVPATFLLLPVTAKKAMVTMVAILAGGFMFCNAYLAEPQVGVDPTFLSISFFLCTIGTFTLLGSFYFLFYLETHRVDLLREQAALHNLAQYRELVENVREGVFRTAHDGRVLAANPALAQMLGDASVEALMERVCDFRRQILADGVERRVLQQRLDEGDRVTAFEMQVLKADGSRIWAALSTRAIRDEHGIVVAYDGIVADISERRRNEQLALEREVAEAATQAKSEFLAKMSHEIRTPMNAVIGFTDLALQSDSAPRRLGYLEQIRSASHSLLAIINDILDISKIEAGKLVLEDREFRLLPLLEKLSDMFAVQAAQKGIELVLAVAPALPMVLRGDPLRLEQVLINLVNNAIKFTERGEVELRVARDANGQGHWNAQTSVPLQFSVRDTGIGIAPDKAATLFTAFTQADNSITRRFGGTGLGLAICKQLVDLMGGRIGLDSMPGVGSTFRFTLPFGRIDPSRDAAAASGDMPSSLRGLPVLLVDDNLAARQVYEQLLRSLHFQPLAVASAQEALAALPRQDWAFALMDWQMPEIDGVEASRRIHREKPALPIVLMTAYGREDVMQSAEGAGISAFLRKPVKASELVDTLMGVLRPGAQNGARTNGVTVVRQSSLRGAGILLVEDNALNQQLASELLRGQGAVVEIAGNGALALAAVDRMPFDLVLMDMQMPVMDGLEATRRIRASGRHDALPIIAMTANAMDSDRSACMDAGMNDFIAKPIDLAEVLAVISRWLHREAAVPVPPGTSPNTAADVPPLPPLPGVNLDNARRRMGDQVALLPELLRGFVREHGGDARSLRQQLDRGEREAAQTLAHTLKGVAANLSLDAVYAAAARIETALRQGDAANAQSALALLERYLSELEAPPPAVPVNGAQALDRLALLAALKKLHALLAANSFDAEALCQSLRPSLDLHFGAEAARRIGDPLAHFDFVASSAALAAALRGVGFDAESA